MACPRYSYSFYPTALRGLYTLSLLPTSLPPSALHYFIVTNPNDKESESDKSDSASTTLDQPFGHLEEQH